MPEKLDHTAISKYISDAFAGLNIAEAANGDRFFTYDPDRNLEPDKWWPFATLVTSDAYDTASNLNREGVFRLNIGISKATFNALLGPQPPRPGQSGIIEGEWDFTALDTIMPHPIYGNMFWVSVLNPGDVTFETVKKLLAEAYEMAVAKYVKRKPAAGS